MAVYRGRSSSSLDAGLSSVVGRLESRLDSLRARPAVRLAGIVLMAIPTICYLVLISIVLLSATTARERGGLAFVWLLGAVALVMLLRFGRHIVKEIRATRAPASNYRMERP